jgi:hypothetical protein
MADAELRLLHSLDLLAELIGLHGGSLQPHIERRCLTLLERERTALRGRLDRLAAARQIRSHRRFKRA